jgi:hypothetical protein
MNSWRNDDAGVEGGRVEAPILGVSKAVEDLLVRELPEEVRASLHDILQVSVKLSPLGSLSTAKQTLRTSDMYRPQLSAIIADADALTERWLHEELGFRDVERLPDQDKPHWEPPSQEISTLASIQFDITKNNYDSLLAFSASMFEELGLVKKFRIDLTKLRFVSP